MESKTGCKSSGELEMTCSTSAVAVCCCSELAELVEQAGVLDSDDGLRREFLTSSICLSVNGRDLLAVNPIDADHSSSLSIGTVTRRSAPPIRRVIGAGFSIGQSCLECERRLSCASYGRRHVPAWGYERFSPPLLHESRRAPWMAATRNASPSRSDIAPKSAPHSRTAFANIVSNTGSSSPGEQLMTRSTSGSPSAAPAPHSVIRALAQLVEQARVLDGDDGLVGEILDQLDLLFGKWPDLLPINDESADQFAFLFYGYGNKGPCSPVLTRRSGIRFQ